mgnify:FL=1|tara:strand:- start:542 stop:1372 length:831 start_codon:yes stop_codon:yes gene_type:complete
MKKDLKDCTFIIPIRIESNDRLRNIITVLCYLNSVFDTNIIVKEVDTDSKFDKQALPQITEYCGDVSNINYIFEQSDDPLFLREKILNEMLILTKTKVIVNYDCDMILPIDTYLESYRRIMEDESDMIYPYGEGRGYLSKVNTTDTLVSDFLNDDDYDLSILKRSSVPDNAGYGWIQFLSRDVYFEGGMENENFMGSAPDDYERHHRFKTLGYRVHRINSEVFHLEHARGMNSYPQSMTQHPYWQHNWDLWCYLEKCNKEQLLEYYSKQEYLKKYQ